MKVELLNVMGDDLMVANVARVSFNKYHETLEPSDEKLIKYLAEHNHWSPFGHPQIQFRITVPIFVARQWFKSTVGSIRNEVSRRYVDEAPEFFRPTAWRQRPEKSLKQGSGESLRVGYEYADEILNDVCEFAEESYERLLRLGVAPEQARMILPQNTYTTWIETASLAFWARFCNLRIDAHAQKEIQMAAQLVAAEMNKLFPISWEALCH